MCCDLSQTGPLEFFSARNYPQHFAFQLVSLAESYRDWCFFLPPIVLLQVLRDIFSPHCKVALRQSKCLWLARKGIEKGNRKATLSLMSRPFACTHTDAIELRVFSSLHRYTAGIACPKLSYVVKTIGSFEIKLILLPNQEDEARLIHPPFV